mmetsp:Transcript_12214/g.42291  ORF Transcript_12214/g.42291 Transcript_12214/m.42291 type:complete len:108 (-) Transcript_12214:106-429(-)
MSPSRYTAPLKGMVQKRRDYASSVAGGFQRSVVVRKSTTPDDAKTASKGASLHFASVSPRLWYHLPTHASRAFHGDSCFALAEDDAKRQVRGDEDAKCFQASAARRR